MVFESVKGGWKEVSLKPKRELIAAGGSWLCIDGSQGHILLERAAWVSAAILQPLICSISIIQEKLTWSCISHHSLFKDLWGYVVLK